MTFALSPGGLHAFRERSNKAPIVMPKQQRACKFCGQLEFRSQFRANRCRSCRKAQP